jgi:hypothetical protein
MIIYQWILIEHQTKYTHGRFDIVGNTFKWTVIWEIFEESGEVHFGSSFALDFVGKPINLKYHGLYIISLERRIRFLWLSRIYNESRNNEEN